MPVHAIGAGISAIGSVAGGIATGKGAKKAAKAAAQGAEANRKEYQQFWEDAQGMWQPTIDRGNNYSSVIDGLNGLGGEAEANAAFDRWRNATGYQFQLDQGLGAVNSNAYASGMGDSGATLKALQDRGNQIASQSYNNYYNQLLGQQALGQQAMGNLMNANQWATQGMTNANDTQYGTKAQSAVQSASGWANAMNGVGQAAMGYAGAVNSNNQYNQWLASQQPSQGGSNTSSYKPAGTMPWHRNG